ncbi:unnamed protein product [Symbiodinium natans]|uniref:Uncharacterized protein n=1 Tax=Symbiodinium natans TaxID=878477 RepID=A0A812LNB1_9DINO|nr:unnamed protein product [Symbiodinium natans]
MHIKPLESRESHRNSCAVPTRNLHDAVWEVSAGANDAGDAILHSVRYAKASERDHTSAGKSGQQPRSGNRAAAAAAAAAVTAYSL